MTRFYNFRTDSGYRTNQADYVNYRDPSGDLVYGNHYTYDGSGRLASIADSGTFKERASYVYDKQGQLTKAKVDGKTYSYVYDTAGNIRSKTENGTAHTYTYGDASWLDLLTAYDGHAITYDAIGNPLTYHDGKTFTWTQGRRLAAIGSGISYEYDMAGVRSSKTVDGTQ